MIELTKNEVYDLQKLFMVPWVKCSRKSIAGVLTYSDIVKLANFLRNHDYI